MWTHQTKKHCCSYCQCISDELRPWEVGSASRSLWHEHGKAESELALVDAVTNCVHWQWFSKVFPSPCSNILHGIMLVFNAVLSEGLKWWTSSHPFCAYWGCFWAFHNFPSFFVALLNAGNLIMYITYSYEFTATGGSLRILVTFYIPSLFPLHSLFCPCPHIFQSIKSVLHVTCPRSLPVTIICLKHLHFTSYSCWKSYSFQRAAKILTVRWKNQCVLGCAVCSAFSLENDQTFKVHRTTETLCAFVMMSEWKVVKRHWQRTEMLWLNEN